MTDNSKFVLRWEIGNAAAVQAAGYADKVFNEGGFRWIAKIDKNSRSNVDFTLSCGVDHSRPWKCEANVKFRLLYPDGTVYDEDKKCSCDGYYEFPRFENIISWAHLTHPNYVVNDTLTVEFHIDIISAERGEQKEEAVPNKFAAPNNKSNVILKIGKEKLHVSKEYLAFHSPVFEAMFFGNFVEKGKEEVEIKDVVSEEFVDLLNVVYLENVEITDRSVLHIFKLADEFQIERVREMAKKHLMKSTGINAVQKLAMADKYNFVDLRDHCLNSFTSVAELNKKIMSSLDSVIFSGEMKIAIYDRIVELNLQ